MAGELTWKELNEQPAAWRYVLRRPTVLPLPAQDGELVFLGAGMAYYLARALATLAESYTGRSCRALPSQELFLHPGATSQRERAFVLLSRTGDVSDAVRGIEAARRGGVQGSFTVIIGEGGGRLAGLADTLIECGVFESSVATTKTLTAMAVAAIQGLLAAAGRHEELAQLQRLPGILENHIAAWSQQARLLARMGFDQVVFLGTGPLFGLAEAVSLTACEMALLQSSGHHALVYLHGRKVTVTDRTLAVFLLSDEAREEELKVVAELRRLGARAVVIAEHADSLNADVVLEFRSGVNEGARLPLYAVFPQLLGYHSAILKGLNPDRPPKLAKVF